MSDKDAIYYIDHEREEGIRQEIDREISRANRGHPVRNTLLGTLGALLLAGFGLWQISKEPKQ